MSKCFITKLPSSVDNDNLPVLGQLRIKWLKKDSLQDKGTRVINLMANDDVIVKVSGAHFTDHTLTSNNGNIQTIKAGNSVTSLVISNDADAVLTIDNKYALTTLNFGSSNSYNENIPAYFDIEDIKYCSNLINLCLAYTNVSGNISALSNLTNLTTLNMSRSKVTGDISALSNLTNLTTLNMDYSNVSGNISALRSLTKLVEIKFNFTNINGDVDNLANLTSLNSLQELKGTSLTGDMSKIPINVSFISQLYRKVTTNFTWTAGGRQNAKFLAMEGPIPFDTASMDNMLIDQATCTFTPNASRPWFNVISVSGIRTSASDAAVATLQSKGVTITGVTKVS